MGASLPFRTMTLALVATVVVTPVVFNLASARFARGADDPAAGDAKKHYEEGTKAFNLGEYPRAITEFKATYNAKPDPLLLYNIAQSYRLAGDAGQAVFFYKSFLRNMPAATNRKEVEGRIHTLEKQIADQKKEPGDAVVTPPVPAPVPPPTTVPPPITPLATPPHVDAQPPATIAAESTENTRRAHESSKIPPAAIPPLATSPSNVVDLTTPSPPPDEPDRPIYKKWWFWAGAVGAVLIIGGLASANAKKAPNTVLGTYDPTFM